MQTVGKSTQLLRQLLLAALVCCGVTADAAVVENLYEGIVERPTDVSDPRAAAEAAAMAQVLVRVTGNRLAASAPELSPLLENPAGFVASFGYTIEGEAQVVFLPNSIERELRIAGWPLWGAERPLSILWIAVTDQFGDQAVLSAGDPPEGALYSEHMRELLSGIRTDIETVALARGVPYVLPTFATLDDLRLSFEEIWRYSVGNLTEFSSSYEADAVVIARVRESVIGTDVEWLLQTPSSAESFPGTGVTEGINLIADAYARDYVTTGDVRNMTLRVTGINNFDNYARVLAYLESVTLLNNVYVESYAGGELLLRAESRGDAGVLVRTFGLDNVLRQPGQLPPGPGGVLDLVIVPEPFVFDGFDSAFSDE